MKFGGSGGVSYAVLGVVSQQNLDDLWIGVHLTADAEVERRQAVQVQTVDRRAKVQQSLTTSPTAQPGGADEIPAFGARNY